MDCLEEDRGRASGSVWTDMPGFQTVNNTGEYLGYKTQKPVALLGRMIRSSSNPSNPAMDPFCGRASTIETAERPGRRWIGIHVAIRAIKRVETCVRKANPPGGEAARGTCQAARMLAARVWLQAVVIVCGRGPTRAR